MKKFFILLFIFFFLTNVYAIQIDQDMTSGIILSADENIVPADTVLSVKTVNDTNTINVATNFGFTDYKAYSISLLENATRIIPNGEVTLSFPLPNNYNINFPNEIFIIKAGSNGNAEKIYTTYQDNIGLYEEMTINNNFLIISTSDFSLNEDTIYLVGTTRNLVTTTTTTKINNPETIDTGFKNLLIATIVGIGGIMLLFTKWYLDNKN